MIEPTENNLKGQIFDASLIEAIHRGPPPPVSRLHLAECEAEANPELRDAD